MWCVCVVCAARLTCTDAHSSPSPSVSIIVSYTNRLNQCEQCTCAATAILLALSTSFTLPRKKVAYAQIYAAFMNRLRLSLHTSESIPTHLLCTKSTNCRPNLGTLHHLPLNQYKMNCCLRTFVASCLAAWSFACCTHKHLHTHTHTYTHIHTRIHARTHTAAAAARGGPGGNLCCHGCR